MQIKSSEVLILLAAAVMSFLANLPDNMLGSLVDRKVLLVALTSLVVVAMFRYLQMMLLLTICVLAIGANLPSELAAQLGISQLALLVSLGGLIGITLLNRVLKLLPTHKESLDEVEEEEDRWKVMLAAISKGDVAAVQQMLIWNYSVNFSLNGVTPLHLAAEKGHSEIVRMLIKYGADYRRKNAEGKTALEIGIEKHKRVSTTDIAYKADNPYTSTIASAENKRADGEIWQTYLVSKGPRVR
jgi:ankyrin repeat protein